MIKNISQLATEYSQSEKPLCISTGFPQLDRLINGFSAGEFIAVGGRPGIGKTQMLVSLSLNISQTYPVLFLTFELPERHILERFLASLSDVEYCKIAQNRLNEEEKSRLDVSLKTLDNYRLFIGSCAQKPVEQFMSYCRQAIHQHKIKVIMIDTIQSLLSDNENDGRKLNDICLKLKNMAKETGACVIASTAISRYEQDIHYLTDRLPRLCDISDFGNMEDYVDKVLFVLRDDYYGIYQDIQGNNIQDIVDIWVAKNNRGATGHVTLKRTKNFTRILDPKTKEETDKEEEACILPF